MERARTANHSIRRKTAESNRNPEIHPFSKRRSRHREIIFQSVRNCGRCRSRTRTLARHPVFGTGVCTTQTSPSRSSTRGGNRTRACALKARRPRPLDHASSVPPAGFEPAHRASETRVTSTYGGEIDAISRCSSPGNRTPPSGLEDPSPIHRPSHRAASIGRESNPRSALCRRVPCHLATDAAVRRWRAPESNRPQPHCKCSSPPWYMPPHGAKRSRRGSNSPGAVDSRTASPEAYGTNSGVRGNRTLAARFTGSRADHYTTHTMVT
jgi:hypothetical protein